MLFEGRFHYIKYLLLYPIHRYVKGRPKLLESESGSEAQEQEQEQGGQA